MFADAVDKLLADHCTPARVRAVERGDTAAATALWRAFADGGFLELMTDEAAGGAGLALDEVFPIFVAFGRHALPVPAAQSIAARVLLAGAAPPEGMIALAGHARRGADGSVSAAQVACGALADVVLADVDDAPVLLDAARAERRSNGVPHSLAASLHWPRDAVGEAVGDAGREVAVFSAAIHAAAMAGAMQRLFDLTLGYCNDRVQFGRPIGKFQAVQHQLAVMAEHIACAGAAAELAFAPGAKRPSRLAAATAKARTSMAVPIVAQTAHALHGAIGITEAHDLQLYSRRLHEWRMADGSEAHWNRILGEALLDAPTLPVLDFVKEHLA